MSDVDPEPAGRIRGWSRAVTAWPWATLLLALAFVAFAAIAGRGAADHLSSGGWVTPGAESTRAEATLDEHFPAARPNLLLMVRPRGGSAASVDDPRIAAQARELSQHLASEKSVSGVISYWDTHLAGLRAKNGSEALITAQVRGSESQADKVLERIAPAYRGVHGDLDVSLGGAVAVRSEIQKTIKDDLLRAELIALPVTLVLLVAVFGSAVAALLPLGIGVIAILGTNAVLRGITSFTDVSIFAQNLTTALGLGLAVDYSLFVVRRFREELPAAGGPREAVAVTLRTAGRTVLFSALTVAVSLSAMLIFPQYFLRSFAYAGIAVVLLAAVAALTVLPAALTLLGHRVNALNLRRLVRRRAPRPDRESDAGWARLAHLVMRGAPLFAIATTAGLVILGAPFLRVQFGSVDYRALPTSAEAHQVHQQIRDGFPASPSGGIEILVRGTPRPSAIASYAKEVSGLPGVVQVDSPAGEFAAGAQSRVPGPGEAAQTAGPLSYITVQPTGEAVDSSSQDLVRQVRALHPPFKAEVAGSSAQLVDTEDAIGSRLPLAGGMIALTTLVLIFLLTGSVLIPLQAVVLNALSLSAMFGAVVWVFQEGHLSGLLNFTATGSIETTEPVLMFCVAFGLSMDYGVFLLSRIKEQYDLTGDHRGSVAFGVRRTGGVITAAAAILAVVLVAIGSSRVANVKMIGLGIALAVVMDAMFVRVLLVPSVLRLTGEASWWAPGPLRRLQARFALRDGAEQGSGKLPAPDADRRQSLV